MIEGGRRRLRPILMTAIATIFALLPMALGLTGEGGFISQPLAVVVIGGLLSSTLLTLVLVPTLYTMVENTKESLRRSPGAGGPDAPPSTASDRRGPAAAAASGAGGRRPVRPAAEAAVGRAAGRPVGGAGGRHGPVRGAAAAEDPPVTVAADRVSRVAPGSAPGRPAPAGGVSVRRDRRRPPEPAARVGCPTMYGESVVILVVSDRPGWAIGRSGGGARRTGGRWGGGGCCAGGAAGRRRRPGRRRHVAERLDRRPAPAARRRPGQRHRGQRRPGASVPADVEVVWDGPRPATAGRADLRRRPAATVDADGAGHPGPSTRCRQRFFLVGARVRRHAGLIRGRLGRHEVGNHSWAAPTTWRGWTRTEALRRPAPQRTTRSPR